MYVYVCVGIWESTSVCYSQLVTLCNIFPFRPDYCFFCDPTTYNQRIAKEEFDGKYADLDYVQEHFYRVELISNERDHRAVEL